MNPSVQSLGLWLADYYLAATLILVIISLVIKRTRHPSLRLAMAWATTGSLLALVPLTAISTRPSVHLTPGVFDTLRTPESVPAVEIVSTVEVRADDVTPDLLPTSQSGDVRAAFSPVGSEANAASVPAAAVGLQQSTQWLQWLLSVVLFGFGCGALAMIGWLGFGFLFAELFQRQCQTPSSEWQGEFARIAGPRGRRVRLLVSARLNRAVVVGVSRPTIVLPLRFLQQETRHDVRDALRHEWAHIANRDLWLAALMRMLMPVLYLHPIYWWLRRQIVADQEHRADLAVVRYSRRSHYAENLIRWTREYGSSPSAALRTALGLWQRPHLLSRRVQVLLDDAQPIDSHAPRRWFVFTMIAITCLTFFVSVFTVAPTSPAVADDRTAQSPATALSAADAVYKSLVGTVVDELGQTLGGVQVDFCPWTRGHDCCTDDLGRFRCEFGSESQPVPVRFTKTGYSPKMLEDVRTAGANWTIQLNHDTYIEGRVTNGRGNGVAKTVVRANQGPKMLGSMHVRDLWTETTTESDGSYRLYLEPDEYDIEAQKMGEGVVRVRDVSVTAASARRVDLELEPGVQLRATVVDAQSKQPIDGVKLWAWQQPHIEGVADATGAIEINDVLPGRYRLHFKDERFARWWFVGDDTQDDRRKDAPGWRRSFDPRYVEVSTDMQPLTILLERAARITGRVVDPNGEPVAGATVSPVLTGAGRSISGDTRFTTRTDADGSYELRLPASGQREYHLVAHDGDYQEWRRWANGVGRPLQTEPGQHVGGVELQLSHAATIRGRVTDPKGLPVVGQRVYAHPADRSGDHYFAPAGVSAADGSFEIPLIRPGETLVQTSPLRAASEPAPEGTSIRVNVTAGQTTSGVELISDPSSSAAQQDFASRYRLDEDEALRLIPPSDVEIRRKWDIERRSTSVAVSRTNIDAIGRYRSFIWSGRGLDGQRKSPIFNTHPPRIEEILTRVIGASRFDYTIGADLLNMTIEGDWIVRHDASLAAKMNGLVAIVQRQKNMTFALRQVTENRKVVVVSGTFHLRPTLGTFDDRRIAFWVDELHTESHAGGGGGSLARMCRELGNIVGVPVVNLATGPPHDDLLWAWHDSKQLSQSTDGSRSEEKVQRLLDHLATQTSLEFRIESRPIINWVATDSDTDDFTINGTRESLSHRRF